MAYMTFLYGNDETEFSKRLIFVEPQLIAFAKGAGGRNWMVAAMNCVFSERESHMEHSIRGLTRSSDGFVGGSVDPRLVRHSGT